MLLQLGTSILKAAQGIVAQFQQQQRAQLSAISLEENIKQAEKNFKLKEEGFKIQEENLRLAQKRQAATLPLLGAQTRQAQAAATLTEERKAQLPAQTKTDLLKATTAFLKVKGEVEPKGEITAGQQRTFDIQREFKTILQSQKDKSFISNFINAEIKSGNTIPGTENATRFDLFKGMDSVGIEKLKERLRNTITQQLSTDEIVALFKESSGKVITLLEAARIDRNDVLRAATELTGQLNDKGPKITTDEIATEISKISPLVAESVRQTANAGTAEEVGRRFLPSDGGRFDFSRDVMRSVVNKENDVVARTVFPHLLDLQTKAVDPKKLDDFVEFLNLTLEGNDNGQINKIVQELIKLKNQNKTNK